MAEPKSSSARKRRRPRRGRKRLITVRDGDEITLVDRHGNGVLRLEFRGDEDRLDISVIGEGGTTTNPVMLGLDASLVGHQWPEPRDD